MWNDVRFALRTLRRSPGFTLVAILSLALGIGANAAIFSLLYQVTLRSLPVKDPQTLVLLASDDFNLGFTRRDNTKTVFSYPMYQALRDRNQVLSGLIGRASFPVSLAWRGDALRATAEVVTGNFFEVLGLKPALGRLLVPGDDGVPGENPVIVLSYSYWESHLGRDPGVSNSRILMNRHPVLVVGIAPQGFRGLLAGQTPDFFAPLSMTEIVAPGWHWRDHPSAYWLNLLGRLRPGVGRQKAEAMLLPLFRSTFRDGLEHSEGLSEEHRKRILAKPLTLVPAAQGLNEFGERFRTPLVVLMVMVGLVLLIACTNVASLLIARATARQRETAMRLALGASGWQVVRQLMIESLGLTLLGALAGVFISGVLAKGLLSFLPADESGGWLAAHVDLRVVGFSFVLSLVTGLLFGLVPALQAARPDLAPALKEQGGGLSAGGSQPRIRRGLVVAQICISLLLLTGAGLFTRSLVNLLAVDLGFRPDRLVSFTVEPSLSGYSWQRTLALFDGVQQRLRGLPSVVSVSGAAFSPFGGVNWGNGVKVPGSRYANDRYVDCQQNSVGPGYFRTLGIPLLRGREFDAGDARRSPKVAVINQTFARFLFENGDPLGRHMVIGSNESDVQIVGVLKDSKFGGVREKPGRFMYVPYEQADSDFVKQTAFIVRTSGDERAVMAAVRSTVRQLDPNLPIARLTSMQVMIHDSIYRDRLLATLAIAFGVLATVLAAVGLYGTVSYSVTRRTCEFGIRLVLGAAPGKLLLMVMREVGWLIVIGAVIGLPLSYVLARLAASQFYGIDAHDPWVLIGAVSVIAGVAFCAGLAPALRAMRIQPIRALRYE